MAAKFLNDLLVSSGRFSPGKGNQDPAPRDEHHEKADSEHEQNPRKLDGILRKEEKQAQKAAETRATSEVNRRKDELLQLLMVTSRDLQEEQRFLTNKIELFKSVENELRQLPAEISSSELRQARQSIRKAHIELTKFSRRGDRDQEDQMLTSPNPTAASFRQLTKIGIAMTWPVLLGIFLATGIILLAMFSLFSV